MPTLGFILTLGIQAYCIYHCYKNKKEVYWYFIIFFFSVIGCIIYFLTQVLKKDNIEDARENLVKVIDPGSEVRRLKAALEFSDAHQNRTALADAYVKQGLYDEAIALYEASRKGMYESDSYLAMQLMLCYYHTAQYGKVVELHKFVDGKSEFKSSEARIAYAKSLEVQGDVVKAKEAFVDLDRSYSNYEHRYEYALFLQRQHQKDAARELLETLQKEFSQLGKNERAHSRKWADMVRRALTNQ